MPCTSAPLRDHQLTSAMIARTRWRERRSWHPLGMSFVTEALRRAQGGSVCAEIVLKSGERILTGVREVNESQGFVSLFAPMTFGDDATTREVALDEIASVTVTDVRWE